MNRRFQLIIILCVVIIISSIISHMIIPWLKIRTTGGSNWSVGPVDAKSSVFMAGSSLAGDGISWGQISDVLLMRIEGSAVAGSSPAEWERFQHLTTQTKLTVLVVSPYDLNEYFICDLRAEIVPLGQTIRDIWQVRADWPFSKYVLSMYPLTYVRYFFPTAGRSDGVMVGFREKLKRLMQSVVPLESEAGPTLSFGESTSYANVHEENISMWDSGKMLRRLTALRKGSQGRHAFNGPKRLAFLRMLRKAQEQGIAVVVVLPVSPAYSKEFLTPEMRSKYEDLLRKAEDSVPQSRWVRLDQLDELNSNEYFWDLVHMNSYGQKIATEALLGRLMEMRSLL